MIHGVYCLFDVKAKVYSLPFCAASDVLAQRMCDATVNDPGSGSMPTRFPEDFRLYKVGDFDDGNGGVFPTEPPLFVCQLDMFRRGES